MTKARRASRANSKDHADIFSGLTPEQQLAIAIIRRAVTDWYQGMATEKYYTINYRQKNFKVLKWFFFEREPSPMNLEYLCEHFLPTNIPDLVRMRLGKPAEWWNGSRSLDLAQN